jgi:hypothetical protein
MSLGFKGLIYEMIIALTSKTTNHRVQKNLTLCHMKNNKESNNQKNKL